MSMESRLVELKKRHVALDQLIESAKLQPSIDALEIVALKRKKLSLKDQINRLSINHRSH